MLSKKKKKMHLKNDIGTTKFSGLFFMKQLKIDEIFKRYFIKKILVRFIFGMGRSMSEGVKKNSERNRVCNEVSR